VAKARENFRKSPIRERLQPYLEDRLINATGEFPVASSWFVCDRFGNQVASAFRSASPTLCKNYSYRTYFTGLPQDLTISQAVRFDPNLPYEEMVKRFEQRPIIQRPHLSAAFRSEQSNSWKLAFSTPVIRDGQTIGLVAVTVDLGNFIDFENQQSHYAMLVDNRVGDNRGIILEHPLFQKLLALQEKLPDDVSRSIVDLDALEKRSETEPRFRDPVGKHPLGSAYDREAVVGRSDVMLLKSLEPSELHDKSASDLDSSEESPKLTVDNREKSERQPTGLVVLALEDYASVVAPANNLIYQWGRLAAFASFFLLTVSIGMWFFVRRLLQESREKLERVFSPSRTESISFRTRETLLATDVRKSTEAK
jgi:hypothetical protein